MPPPICAVLGYCAKWHAAGANAQHGLRRTNADKRRAVLALLEDEEWAQWSDREIARRCGVGNKFVGDVRDSICVPNTDTPRLATRNGTTYQQQTANIGKRSAATLEEPPAEPGSPVAAATNGQPNDATVDEPQSAVSPESEQATPQYRASGAEFPHLEDGPERRTFGNQEEAARAYDKAALAYFGPEAKTNESLGLLAAA